MKKLILLLGIGIWFIKISYAQNSLQRVKIPADNRTGEILALLEIDHFFMQDGFIISEITEQAVQQLKRSGLPHQVLSENVGRELDSLNTAFFAARNNPVSPNRVAIEQNCKTVSSISVTPAAFEVKQSFGGYYNYAEMETAIDNLVAAFPALAQKVAVGTSAGGTTIWAVKISDNVTTDESNEPELLYMALQHAREAIGGSSMIFLMQYLCENYNTDLKIKALVDNREFFIIPCANPDGWEFNHTSNPNGGGGWRKNRRLITGSTRGVDLNRNYSVDWGNCSPPIQGNAGNCGSTNPTADTYFGPNPFSEPETNGLRNFITTHHFIAAIDQHCFGPYYSLPFGRSSLHRFSNTPGVTVLDSTFYSKTAALMGKYNGMRAGNSFQTVGYEVAGGFKDWMLLGDIGTGTKTKAFGLTGEGGTGGGSGGQFSGFWAPAGQIENLCKGMTYQNLQLAFVAGSYVDIQDVTDVALTSLNGTMEFSLRRLGLQNAPVTVSLVPMQNIQSNGSPVTTSLANYNDIFNGSISYILPANLTAGQRVKFAWKVETGGQTYMDTITKFFNPLQLFSDNMEGSSVTNNWTITGGGWAYTTTSAFQGSKSLAESPTGNYPFSAIRIATYKNPLNLSDATATFLSMWVRHRAENFHDKLQVQVSTNGGTTWVPVCGKTTVQEPGTFDGSTINGQPSLTGIQQDWIRELIDLSNFNGQSAVRFRLVFTSDGDGTEFAFRNDDGFFIDNLKVIKSVISAPAVQATAAEARAIVDNQKTVLFPNPVDNELNIQVGTDVTAIQLTDLEGRVLMKMIIRKVPGNTSAYKIDMQSLHAGLYFVNFINDRGQIIETKKIMKQ